MPKLIICRGLPASGKTTWATGEVNLGFNWVLTEGHPATVPQPLTCRVNRDDIRAMLHNSTFIKGVTEDVVIAVRNNAIKAALRKGWNVISDDTNLRSRNVNDLLKIAVAVGAEVEFKDFTDVDVEECIRRDAIRGANDPLGINRFVGEEVIRDQYNRFIKGKQLPLPVPELGKALSFEPVVNGDISCVVVDIDGTVAINNGHRGFFEYDKVSDDDPNVDVIDAVRALYFNYGACFFVSGRSDSCYAETKKWIETHVFYDSYPVEDGRNARSRIVPQGVFLLMRQDGDYRDDALVKYELYRDYIAPKFNVKLVLDDRDRVVRMWRQIGLLCAQVGYGDF